MNAEEFARLREILLQIADLPQNERLRFLDRSCPDSAELRHAALRLLEHDRGTPPGPVASQEGAAANGEPDLPEQLGRYKIARRLGTGGMGIVYLGTDPDLGREVAIKIVPEALSIFTPVLERFRQEARLLARLNHPNIATVYSLERDGGRVLLTMEHIDGQTLADALLQGHMPLDSVLPIVRQIACALEAAHGSGIVHRDLKPANVLITREGLVKVLDFGIAKLIGRPGAADDAVLPTESPSRGSSGPMGTPGYMSPEQILGAPADARADIWSFGCILHESLTGAPLFDGPAEVRLRSTLEMDYHPGGLPQGTPAHLRALLPRLLARDVTARLESIGEARQTIDSVLEAREFQRVRSRRDREREEEHPPVHLPLYLTRFFGRTGELEVLAVRLAAQRLVSLVGSGGCGKTRLAVEAAQRLGALFPDGVWFVDLAAVRDPGVVAQKLAAALGLPDGPGQELRRVVQELAPRDSLLVLDNCEHLVAVCGELVWSLLEGCPKLRILATTREPLAVEGESVLRLAPLPFSEAEAPEGPITPDREPAAALFLDRAVAAAPEFTQTAGSTAAIREICRQVEGLPLAIELSATWARVLGAEEILERLQHRIDLLEAGDPASLPRRGAVARHRGLRAMIDGSYEALSRDEQRLFRGLAVFRGGCTLEALEQVCLASERTGWQALDLVRSLLSKSLIERQGSSERPGASRYRMLETLREYAEEKLGPSGEERDLRSRHFAYYRGLFEKRSLLGPEQALWVARFREDEENLRAALEERTALGIPPAETASFVNKLAGFWVRLGRWDEGRRILTEVLEELRTAGEEALPISVRLRTTCAEIARSQGDFGAAKSLAESAIDSARLLGDVDLIASGCNELGNIAKFVGNYTEALRLYDACLEHLNEAGNPWHYAGVVLNRGVILAYLDRLAEAEADFRESLRVKRAIGDKRGIAHALNALGLIRLSAGALGEVRPFLEESLALKRELQDRPGMVTTLLNLGRLANRSARGGRQDSEALAGARRDLEEALTLAQRIGDRPSQPRLLMELGFTLLLEGKREAARERFQGSLSAQSESRDSFCEVWAHMGLAHLALREAQSEPARLLEARASAQAAVVVLRASGKTGFADVLEMSAAIENAAGNALESVALLALADRLRREERTPVPLWWEEWVRAQRRALERELDPAAFQEAWEAGASRSIDT